MKKETIKLFKYLNKLVSLLKFHDEKLTVVSSYQNVCEILQKNLSVRYKLFNSERLENLGINSEIAKEIVEYYKCGKINKAKDLLHKTPFWIIDILNIDEISIDELKAINKVYTFDTYEQLMETCSSNILVNSKIINESKQNFLLNYSLMKIKCELSINIEAAIDIVNDIKNIFESYNLKILPTGQIRRSCEVITSLDFVLPHNIVIEEFLTAYKTKEVTKNNLCNENHGVYKNKVRMSFFLCENEKLQNTLFYSTIVKTDYFAELNKVQNIEKILSGNNFNSEKDIYSYLNLGYLEPEMRETKLHYDYSSKKISFDLIKEHDIKGIIHSHTTYSDGYNTLTEMCVAAKSNGYEYIVISDHSFSSNTSGGLTLEEIERQHEEIDKLNEELTPFKIFKSIECDILEDGSLDYDNNILIKFDLIIASVHDHFQMNEKEATQRLLKAIGNPYVTIIGHLTSKLYGKTKGLNVDHVSIIEKCRDHKVVIEINGDPNKLDISWRYIDYALSQGVLLSINPDAHSIDNFNNIKYAIANSRKGGLTKSMNLSSYNLYEFQSYINSKK